MPNLGDSRKSDEGLRVLCLGKDGSGKSTAIASFADAQHPMYIFDIDHRINGIRGSNWLTQTSLPYIDYDQYDAADGFKVIFAKFQEFEAKNKKKELKYKNIVIDGVSSLLYMFYQDSLELKKAANEKGIRKRGILEFLNPDDYMYGSRALRMFFYDFFPEFPKVNFFMTGWTTDRYGKDPAAENAYAPDILLPGQKLLSTGKTAVEIPGYFDEVWQFDKEETAMTNSPTKFSVTFKSVIAKTTFPELNKARRIDITEKSFKVELDRLLKLESSVKEKVS